MNLLSNEDCSKILEAIKQRILTGLSKTQRKCMHIKRGVNSTFPELEIRNDLHEDFTFFVKLATNGRADTFAWVTGYKVTIGGSHSTCDVYYQLSDPEFISKIVTTVKNPLSQQWK